MGNKTYYFSLLSLLLSFAFVGYVALLLFEPFDEPILYEHPFPVLNENKTVERGEELHYRIHFQKRQAVAVTSYPYIICDDGTLVNLSTKYSLPTQSSLPVGEHTLMASQTIPENVTPGDCRLETRVVYEINKLKEVSRIRTTETFTVL